MKIRTTELTGTALDWAVAIAKGIPAEELLLPRYPGAPLFRYLRDGDGNLTNRYMTGPDLIFSRKWEAAGPIIERERIATFFKGGEWIADPHDMDSIRQRHTGPTPLIAAMRCFCASKLGPEIDIPEGLLTGPLDTEVVTWDAKVVTPNSERSDSGWRPAAEAPHDGRTLLFSLKDGSEMMFGRWIRNPWTGDERFTSVNPTDPEAMDWSIPEANLPNWLYFEITPPWEAVK